MNEYSARDLGRDRVPTEQPRAALAAERAEMLRTCPARARSWQELALAPFPPGLAGEVERRERLGLRHDEEYVLSLHGTPEPPHGGMSPPYGFPMSEDEKRYVDHLNAQVTRAANTAHDYLERLPPSQSGSMWLDHTRGVVTLQVTHDAENVRAAVRALVDPVVTVVVETVRYSKAELQQIRAVIMSSGLEWNSISVSADNRVEVTVRENLAAAEALLGGLVDPCALVISLGEQAFATQGSSPELGG